MKSSSGLPILAVGALVLTADACLLYEHDSRPGGADDDGWPDHPYDDDTTPADDDVSPDDDAGPDDDTAQPDDDTVRVDDDTTADDDTAAPDDDTVPPDDDSTPEPVAPSIDDVYPDCDPVSLGVTGVVTFTATLTDSDSSSVAFRWTFDEQLLASGTVDPAAGAVSLAVFDAALGEEREGLLLLSATDDGGLSATRSWTVYRADSYPEDAYCADLDPDPGDDDTADDDSAPGDDDVTPEDTTDDDSAADDDSATADDDSAGGH